VNSELEGGELSKRLVVSDEREGEKAEKLEAKILT